VPSFTYQHTTVCFFGHTTSPVRSSATMASTRKADQLMIEPTKSISSIPAASVSRGRRLARGLLHLSHRQKRRRTASVKYDVETAMEKIIKAGLPRLLAERLKLGADIKSILVIKPSSLATSSTRAGRGGDPRSASRSRNNVGDQSGMGHALAGQLRRESRPYFSAR